MKVDLSFENHYEIKVLEDQPNALIHYFPGGSTEGGKDGILLQIVSAAGKKWIGMFAFGDMIRNGVMAVHSTPDPIKFCVVSRGAGYIVSSENPALFEEVKTIPITEVRSVISHNMLLFADFTDLVAYGPNGIKWRTGRLGYDGFKILEIKKELLIGEFWSLRSDAMKKFAVDLSTGCMLEIT